MAKPNKNRVMCPDCGKPKMLFATEKEALGFIKWNSDEMKHGEKLRPYYCPACCGYHISHKKYYRGFDKRTDDMIDDYRRSLTSKDSFSKKLAKTSVLFTSQAKVDEIISTIKPEDVLRYAHWRHFLKEFLDNWWSTHEKYDGWEEVDRIVRETIKKKYKQLKK